MRHERYLKDRLVNLNSKSLRDLKSPYTTLNQALLATLYTFFVLLISGHPKPIVRVFANLFNHYCDIARHECITLRHNKKWGRFWDLNSLSAIIFALELHFLPSETQKKLGISTKNIHNSFLTDKIGDFQGVYIILNRRSGHTYIGETNKLSRRFVEEIRDSKTGETNRCRSMRRQGNFRWFVLPLIHEQDQASRKRQEARLIKILKPNMNSNLNPFASDERKKKRKKRKTIKERIKCQCFDCSQGRIWGCRVKENQEKKKFLLSQNPTLFKLQSDRKTVESICLDVALKSFKHKEKIHIYVQAGEIELTNFSSLKNIFGKSTSEDKTLTAIARSEEWQENFTLILNNNSEGISRKSSLPLHTTSTAGKPISKN